jgi:hypothetical protein
MAWEGGKWVDYWTPKTFATPDDIRPMLVGHTKPAPKGAKK